MKLFLTSLSPLLFVGLLALNSSSLQAEAAAPTPTGDELLRFVRMNQASQDLKHLNGKLYNDDDEGAEHPFELTMSDNIVRFVFKGPPAETIQLDLKDNGSQLSRTTGDSKGIVAVSHYADTVRRTCLNLEDLSMRFLYWPNSQVMGVDSVGMRKCWVVRVSNPDGRGPYGTVDVWIEQASGAMMQMDAFDMKGKKVKQFKVISGQKYKDAYILKKMRLESYDVDTNKVNGRTYMLIADPE
ncbi:MAG: hypothetical protein RL693_582 [Verrucomicrobiota bacterium]|jgi:hypothetical protein